MNDIQYYICEQQQEIFEYMYDKNVDILRFAEKFMNSDFCNRHLDARYSVHQFNDIVNWVEFLEMEFNPFALKISNHEISRHTAGWIGFVYRHLHFATGLKSSELFQKVPFRKLVIAYPGLHTVDEDMAIDILCNDYHIERVDEFKNK